MNTMFKQFITAVIGVIVLTSPGWAITYGEPDGDGHPFVAAGLGVTS